MPGIITAALSAGFAHLTAGITTAKVIGFALKSAALLSLNYLMTARNKPGPRELPERTEVFASGPARWVLGRAKIGGVIAAWFEDWDVKRTERFNPNNGGADDVHMVVAISGGPCDKIEAVWIGTDRFDVKFDDEAKTQYSRRFRHAADTAQITEGLALTLVQEEQAFWHNFGRDGAWRAASSSDPNRFTARILNEDDPDDAEIIRLAALAQSISIVPWLDDDSTEKWRSVRRYTIRDWPTSDGQDVLWNTATPFADKWTINHKLQGIAGVHVKLRQWTKHDFDAKVFRGGIPDLSFLVRGVKITYPDPSASTGTVTKWTDNAAAIRYWFDTVRRGIDPEDIDRDSFIAAFNVCNEELTPTLPSTWPNDTPPTWAEDTSILRFRKYSINGVVSSGDNPAGLIAEFDDHWQGFAVEDGGRLHYYPGTNQIEADTIESDDLLEYPNFTPAPSLAERSNIVSIGMAQSSFHDFQSFSLQPIDDADKRRTIDSNLYLPFDLGNWRFVINPAHAYSLAIIQLRRARASGTLTLRLKPGGKGATPDAPDRPVKYLEMSAGKVYSVNIPEEGFDGRNMLLISKQINEDMTIDVTLVDQPDDLYDSDYQLPEIPDPPPYNPTRMGSRPYKPDGLTVTSTGRVGDDGTFQFRIRAEVDSSPMTLAVRLTAGSDEWYAETEDNFYVFEINAPVQQMEITVRHIDKYGTESLPVRQTFTPDYDDVVLPVPRWRSINQHGVNALMFFESEAYTAPISGIEIRYTRKSLDSTDDFSGSDILTAETWGNGTPLQADPVQIVRGLDMAVNAIIRTAGRYALFARYVTNISGATQQRGPVSGAYYINVEVPEVPVSSFEEAPGFNGTLHNVYKWTGRQNDVVRGQPIVIMDNPSTSINWENWRNPPNPSSTTAPLPAWPFGEAVGFNQALQTGTLSQGLPTGGNSAWYLTKDQDLGTARAIEVRADIKAFAPTTGVRSGLTIGFAIPDQRWTPNVAITPITLPAATNPIGTITYTLTGLPPGLVFTASTRRLTGTPTVTGTTGTAVYRATDTGGGAAQTSFVWSIGSAQTRPSTPNTPTASAITRTTARANWTAVTGASSYDIEWGQSGGSTNSVTEILSTFYDFTGLTAGTQYFVRVRAVNSAGESSYSGNLTFTTAAALVQPATPTGLELSATNAGDIVASWTTGSNVTSYSVRWKRANQATYPNANIMSLIGSSTYTITGLTRGQAYDVSVRAHNAHPNPSAWSSDVEVTIPTTPTAPVISAVTALTGSHPGVQLTVSTTQNENKLQIGVISDAPDGTHSSDEVIYDFGVFALRRIYNIFPGYTYQFRARSIGVGYQTAWSSTVSFSPGIDEDAPGRITNFRSTAQTHNSVTLAWNEDADATSYRIRWWESNTPETITEITGITTATRTVSGLEPEHTYTFRVNGRNTDGDGLPALADVEATTSEAPIVQAIAPTNLTATADSNTSIYFTWTESANADSYEIQLSTDSTEKVTGIDGGAYSYGGLTAGSTYIFRIRAVNTHSPSAFVNFASVTLPSTNVPNPHRFASAEPMTFTRVAGGRNISYSFTAPVRSNVKYFQIRYAQITDSRLDDFDNDQIKTTWTFLPPIANTQTSGNRTVTGTFDPGYSDRYWTAQVRAYVDTNANGYSAGFGQWGYLTNDEAYDPSSGSDFTLNRAFQNGKFVLSAPTPSISQDVYREQGVDYPRVQIHWEPHTDEFEIPAQSENKIVWTFRTNSGTEYSTPNSYWTFYDEDDNRLNSSPSESNVRSKTEAVRADVSHLGRNGDRKAQVGDIIRVKVQRTCPHMETFLASSFVVYTFVDPDDVPATPNAPTTIRSAVSGSNVVFSWDAVPHASGYEVRTVEDRPGVANSTQELVKQTGSGREYTKVGGRNETFTVKVRAFNDHGSTTQYSGFTQTVYTAPGADNEGLGKVTGLVVIRDPVATSLQFNNVAGANGFEAEYSIDGGSTWNTRSDSRLPRPSGIEGIWGVPLTATSADEMQFRIRALAGSDVNNPTGFSLSWSTVGFKVVPANETGPGVVRNLVAMAREGGIIVDWTAAANASRYRLQSRADSDGTWADVATNISVNTTHYQTTFTAASDRQFRIRAETDEGTGAYTPVQYLSESVITIPAPTISTSSTYTSITVTWTRLSAAAYYDVEYRLNSSPLPAWSTHTEPLGTTATTETITGLSAGQSYQIRVRGKDGGNAGAWAQGLRSTLACDGLSPPATVNVNAGTSSKIRVSWTAVSGATGYRVRIRVGNVLRHTSPILTGTSLFYERTTTQLSNITTPATLQCSVQAVHTDCPNSSYSTEQNVVWNPATITTSTVSTYDSSGNALTAYRLNGTTGSVVLPSSAFGIRHSGGFYQRIGASGWVAPFNSWRTRTSSGSIVGSRNYPYTVPATGTYTFSLEFENGMTLLPATYYSAAQAYYGTRILWHVYESTTNDDVDFINYHHQGTSTQKITGIAGNSFQVSKGVGLSYSLSFSWYQPTASAANQAAFEKMINDAGDWTLKISSTAGGAAGQATERAVAGATGATIDLGSSEYEIINQEPAIAGARPWFNGEFPRGVFNQNETIDPIDIPAPTGGVEPYTIIADGLPGGLSFDASTRQITGTPTDTAPAMGYATFRLEDANGLYETRSMQWDITRPVPANWSEFGGGFGQINNPFIMACATKGNVRPFYFIPGGTNRQAIIDDEAGARARILWLTCPTTHNHTARLHGAASPDYDLVIRVGSDDFRFSDTDSDFETLSVDGHADGALIGIYRYEATTTSSGVNNTGDPLVLEWVPDMVDLPSGASGQSGGAIAGGGEDEATGQQSIGETTTDFYVYYRTTGSGNWTRHPTKLVDGWNRIQNADSTDISIKEFRILAHFRRWKNRAMEAFTYAVRDRQ